MSTYSKEMDPIQDILQTHFLSCLTLVLFLSANLIGSCQNLNSILTLTQEWRQLVRLIPTLITTGDDLLSPGLSVAPTTHFGPYIRLYIWPTEPLDTWQRSGSNLYIHIIYLQVAIFWLCKICGTCK